MNNIEDDVALLKKITICLEQKNLFMTQIMDLTKQIEVNSNQEEVIFHDIFAKRQDSMNRIDKCNALIQVSLNTLSENLQPLVKLAIEGTTNIENNSAHKDSFENIVSLVNKYNCILKDTVKMDQDAKAAFNEKYGDLRERINTIRKQKLRKDKKNSI